MDFIKYAQKYRQDMVDDLISLIKIKSLLDESSVTKEAPFGKGINDALLWFLNKAEMDGFNVKNVDGYAGRISLGHQNESISLLGHLDVVPAKEEQFNPQIKEGFIVARGAIDDKGPSIAAYYAMKILKDLGYTFKHRIDLILGTDEETDMRCMQYYKEHEQLPLMGLVPDAEFPGIYAEKGILNVDLVFKNNTLIKSLTAGTRPNIVIDYATAMLKENISSEEFNFYLRSNPVSGKITGKCIEMNGKAFHASIPYKGINAGIHLLNFIAASSQNDYLKSIVELVSNPFGLGLGIECESAQMEQLTMNVGLIHIDEKEIRLTLDIRYPNETNLDEINSKISKNSSTSIENISDSTPHYIDPSSELVQTALEAYQKVTHDYDSKVRIMGGGTYARTLPNHIAFGLDFVNRKKPSWVQGPHEENEAVEIEALILASAIYCEALIKLAEGKL